MMDFFKKKRTLLAQGPVLHAAFAGRTILVDTIECDLPAFARKLSCDIGQQRLFNNSKPEMIKMVWRPKISLGRAMEKELGTLNGDSCAA